MNNNKNGYSIPEMLIVIGILGVVTIIVLVSTANAFKDNSKNIYDEKINVIAHQAELYGETINSLKTDGSMIITVSDVVKAGYYVADDGDGNVVDPRNKKANLNGVKIKLVYNDGNVKASVMNDD